jgi:hypothetical protein
MLAASSEQCFARHPRVAAQPGDFQAVWNNSFVGFHELVPPQHDELRMSVVANTMKR